MKYLNHLKATPATERARSDQVKNNTGGFVFQIDDWARFKRWLILGSEGGTYYQKEGPLTIENIGVVERCIKADALRVIREIVDVSKNGKAVKNEPAILALAMVAKTASPEARTAANQVLPVVCRIGTHLFYYAECVKHFGGWGDGTKRAFARWYTDKDPKHLALQVIKYRSRHAWSHRDLLRKIHIHPSKMTADVKALLQFAVKGDASAMAEATNEDAQRLIEGFVLAQEPSVSSKDAVTLIRDYGIPREALPTNVLNSPEVWEALLDDQGRGMAVGALVRNLGKMTQVGLLKPMSNAAKRVVEILSDPERIKRSRMHPVRTLIAQKIYAAGKGLRGSLTWSPVKQIVDVMEDTFVLGFDAVEPTGKNFLIGLDVSGSMSGFGGFWGGGSRVGVAGIPGLSPREATSAIAWTLQKTEKWTEIMAFSNRFMPLDWTGRSSLRDVCRSTEGLPFDSTDISLPMTYAKAKDIPVDTFIIMTDNELNTGRKHPYQALEEYRKHMKIAARLIVMATTATNFTVADPRDPLQLDYPGFSTDVPTVIREFTLM